MEKWQRVLVLSPGLLLLIQQGVCQQAQTLVWNTLQVPVQISAKWQLQTDISYRTIGVSGSAFQYTFRAGARCFINNKLNIAAGGALFFTRTSFEKSNHEFGKETRLWQEIVKEIKLNKKLSLFNRFRTEERFFAATGGADDFFAFRLRYRLAAVQQLTEKWKLQLSNEFMEQLSKKKFAFQQNRLGAAAIVEFNQNTQLQVGYIWSKLAVNTQHFVTCTFIKTIMKNGPDSKK